MAGMEQQTIAPVEEALRMLGGPAEVARRRGLKTRWAVAKWIAQGLPPEHVIWLAEQTGWKITPHRLKPDLYPHPEDGLPDSMRHESAA